MFGSFGLLHRANARVAHLNTINIHTKMASDPARAGRGQNADTEILKQAPEVRVADERKCHAVTGQLGTQSDNPGMLGWSGRKPFRGRVPAFQGVTSFEGKCSETFFRAFWPALCPLAASNFRASGEGWATNCRRGRGGSWSVCSHTPFPDLEVPGDHICFSKGLQTRSILRRHTFKSKTERASVGKSNSSSVRSRGGSAGSASWGSLSGDAESEQGCRSADGPPVRPLP